MRFDIRSGGIAGILIGILLLSGAVFVMGLLAGYDIGHQSQIAAQQVAVEYPLPQAPAAAPTPRASLAAASPIAQRPPARISSTAAESAPATRKKFASVAKPPMPVKPDVADETDESPETTDEPAPPAAEPAPTPDHVAALASPAAPLSPRRKPFNIQIQAAMDAASANDMVKRLEALGYRPHMAPTELNGATWYKVVVGPYTTKEEAAVAEVALRKKYNATYGAKTTVPSSDTGSAPEEE